RRAARRLRRLDAGAGVPVVLLLRADSMGPRRPRRPGRAGRSPGQATPRGAAPGAQRQPEEQEEQEEEEEDVMTSLFKDDAARLTLLGWFERFRAKLTVPTESRTVTTRFGDTHVLVGGPAGAPALVVLHGALASSAHVLVELAPLLER